jgi:hypothetical protein
VGVFDSQVSGGKRYDLATAGRRLAHATYYASHGTDEESALSFAMDLTPLVEEPVRRILADLPPSRVEVVNSSEESNELKQAYLDAGVVGPASRNDAAHIALATIFGADLVVSWNFKHIVHFEKIAGYEGVNSLRGYRSPKDLLAARGGEELKQDKEFDCVQMKTEIQERLLREIAELGEEEAARLRRDRLVHDPILGAFLDRKTASSGPHEQRTPAA